MLLPYTTLAYYGPDALSFATAGGLGEVGAMGALHSQRAGLDAAGVGVPFVFRPFRGRNAAFSADGIGSVDITPKHRQRFGLTVKVSELSQDDVTGAVLEAVIEDGLSLKETMRLLLAYAAGDATGLDTNPIFKSQDGSKTRLAGTISAGSRTVTTRDGT